jgi:hypothetical protein
MRLCRVYRLDGERFTISFLCALHGYCDAYNLSCAILSMWHFILQTKSCRLDKQCRYAMRKMIPQWVIEVEVNFGASTSSSPLSRKLVVSTGFRHSSLMDL